jgi:cell fate regulator YaaT (PSP1 superfamily)
MTDLSAEQVQDLRVKVAGVRFTKVGKLYHFLFDDFPDLQPADFVIVETVRGRQMGQIIGFTSEEPGREYRSILRPATPRDLVLQQEWESKQDEALAKCQERATALGGHRDVKFLAARYNYDGSALTFLYSAEDKLELTKLGRDLQRVFVAKVEMRQLGPRDVAKLLGGYGACGADRCCSTFLTDFSPVSIKMAKAQGISLSPSEITGMCGRLRCCLVYEYEQYVKARKLLPRRNKKVGTPFGEGKVIDIHPLRDAVTVWIEEVGRKMVTREELIPLEELRALEKKAKEPCDKHGEGECDCGKPPGKRRADQKD